MDILCVFFFEKFQRVENDRIGIIVAVLKLHINVNPMKRRTSLLTALLCVAAIDNPVVAGDILSDPMKSETIQPSIEISQTTSALRSLAGALSSGSEAMLPLHGSRSEEENKDTLTPAIPGMECYIDRIFTYVSCYSPPIGSEKEADFRFSLIVDELQVALPPDRWTGMKHEPGVESIRSYLYQDQKSAAHIDVDIVPRIDFQGIASYMISMFAWSD
jgi:hypothetical protein